MHLSVVTPLWQDRHPQENIAIAQLADELGYPELWVGEMATYDAFALGTAIGLSTEHIALTLGPLAVSVRTPMNLAMGIASVAQLTGRPTQLALGASSTVVVEQWHGRSRQRTASHMAESAQICRGLLRGEKVNTRGELASCEGYHLRLEAPACGITLAAFSPAAIRAAARHADRLVLNMVTPESVKQLRQQLHAAAHEANREPPPIAVWLTCAVKPSAAALAQLQRAVVGYLAAPGYAQMITAAGFGEIVAFAQSRAHPKAILEAMPDGLMEAIGLLGSESQIDQRIDEYLRAGADEICIVPATAGDELGRKTLTAMSQMITK